MNVVLADGTEVVASASSHPDLFWALRGGGSGSFGVITHFTLNVFQTPLNSMVFLQFKATAEVLDLWQRFFPNTPKEMTCYLRFQIGNTVLLCHHLGPMSELQAIIAESGAEALQSFIFSTFQSCNGIYARSFVQGDLTCSNLAPLHTTPIETAPKDYEKSKSEFVGNPIPMNVLNQLVALWYSAPRPDAYIACNLMGGVGSPFTTISPTDTPFPSRNGTIFVMQYAIPGAKGDYAPGSANYVWLHAVENLLQPYVTGFKYQGYPDLELDNFGLRYYGAANFMRLVSIKQKYDPNNVFHNDQSIPLTYAVPSSLTTATPSATPTNVASAAPVINTVSAISNIIACLGPQLSPFLVTPNTTSSSSYNTYSWLSIGNFFPMSSKMRNAYICCHLGNRARVPRTPIAVLMLPNISFVPTAGLRLHSLNQQIVI